MVVVLLSTYNGEKYLEEQLMSLVNQRNIQVNILVRDDGSVDTTIDILDKWQDAGKLKWYTGDNLRPEKSFMHLLFNAPKADYYAFCDQDDVWLPDKLSKTIDKMKNVESQYPDVPIIIHSDMTVVNSELKKIHSSFWTYSRLRPDILNSYKYLAACNGVNGCTMLLNNKAREIIKEKYFTQKVLLHDILCSLIVSANNGIIDYVDEPTMLYRQHEINVIGARHVDISFFLRKLLLFKEILNSNKERLKVLNRIKKISTINYLYYKIKYLLVRTHA